MAYRDNVTFFASGNSTQVSSAAIGGNSNLVFEGAGIVSIGFSNNRVVVSVPFGGGAGDGYNIIYAGTNNTTGTTWSSVSASVRLNGSNNIIVSQNNSNDIVIYGQFANSNNVSFGYTNGSLTASYNRISVGMSNIGNTAGTSGTFDGAALQYVYAGGNNITLSQSSNAGSVTLSVHGLVFNNANGVTFGTNAGTVTASIPLNATLSTFVPYFPASTSSITAGGFGTTSASAFVFPVILDQDLVFNHIKILQSFSMVSTTNSSGGHTISSQFGIYSNNAGTLSQISSGSLSFAFTGSSVSGTLSFASATGTTGYGYGTSSGSTTAQQQSLWGTAGARAVDMQFGGNMTLTPGIYWIGIHQRQSTSNTAIGLSTAFVGNAMNSTSNVGPIGQSTAAFSSNSAYHLGAHGFYTSTGSAGYGGTQLPSSMLFNGFNNNLNIMPSITFMST